MALSSTDEIEAAVRAGANTRIYPGSVFRDQFEWAQSTIDWFREHPEFSLLVRIHPREYPNRRESRVSPNGIKWEQTLSSLPFNVEVDHPDDGRSLYDLLGDVQLVITGWSSAGLEAAAMGIPVVTYDKMLPGFPDQIGWSGSSQHEYFDNLLKAFQLSGASNEKQELTTKWLVHLFNRGTTRVGGRFLANHRNRLPKAIRLLLAGAERYLPFVYLPMDLALAKMEHQPDGKHRVVLVEGKDTLFG